VPSTSIPTPNIMYMKAFATISENLIYKNKLKKIYTVPDLHGFFSKELEEYLPLTYLSFVFIYL